MRSLGLSPQKQASNPPEKSFRHPVLSLHLPGNRSGAAGRSNQAAGLERHVGERHKTPDVAWCQHELSLSSSFPMRNSRFHGHTIIVHQADNFVSFIEREPKKTTSPTTRDLSTSTGKRSVLFLSRLALRSGSRLFIPCCVEIICFAFFL